MDTPVLWRVDVGEDARTVGVRLRQIRKSRRKSLVVVAGLAGMSKSQLSRIERGEIALDRRSEIVALAKVLQIAPSELTAVPVPVPGDGQVGVALPGLVRDLPPASWRAGMWLSCSI